MSGGRAISGVRAYALSRQRRRPLLHAVVLSLILFGVVASFTISRSFPFEAHAAAPIVGLSLPSVGAAPAEPMVLTTEVLPDTVRREELVDGLLSLAGAPQLQPAPVPEAVEAAAVQTEPYSLYAVQTGDSASAIATNAGIDLEYLLWANAELRDGELLSIGQLLIVPNGNGLLHDVRYGESLSVIADRYNVTVDDIVGWSGNGIGSPDQVVEDQLVFVPNGVPPLRIIPESPVLPASSGPVALAAPVDTAPVSGLGLTWPAYGPISSYYDGAHPLGIDIDLFNQYGGPIAAATNGTVTFAGGNPCCSYGLYVVVMSPNGIETLYAHMSGINVSIGQQVAQGDALGAAGSTGYSTGTHVHFEVIDNGTRVNPLAYLP